MKLKVFTDGGSRGNPGSAGIGVFITDEIGNPLEKRYKSLGIKTNNEAEYIGAFYGIKRAIELGATEIDLFMDSNLVINQLSGNWKIKKSELKELNDDILKIISDNSIKISYNWIERAKNKEADRLSNIAMNKNII
ncbi:reverse transcriptase-like protein [Candidatus Gracilibacteria bacterium]|nr:MAG: reverse transcriptase-like protein [Candidatus Gracilibacteria bacterium]